MLSNYPLHLLANAISICFSLFPTCIISQLLSLFLELLCCIHTFFGGFILAILLITITTIIPHNSI